MAETGPELLRGLFLITCRGASVSTEDEGCRYDANEPVRARLWPVSGRIIEGYCSLDCIDSIDGVYRNGWLRDRGLEESLPYTTKIGEDASGKIDWFGDKESWLCWCRGVRNG